MASRLIFAGLAGLLFFMPAVAFAQNSSAQPKKLSSIELKPQEGVLGEGKHYTLGKDDVVEITVRNQPEFSGRFIVGPDGNIQYTFVGDIKAQGLTKEELKDKITSVLVKYVKVPEVSISIIAYRSKFIYVLGEVGRPGKYPMKGDAITLRDALTESGLPTRQAALRRVYVIKPDTTKPVYKKVDIYKLLYKGIMKNNVTLGPGDLVVVPSTVPSEINRALTTLLSPITRGAAVEAIVSGTR